ncbi:MAG: NADH-ubiquinone oxidoreductase chain E (EC [uncultured Sulfurovum sp.]|uniref:NADH-ubiquinone oxidoreductase chain E (EC) n=1 Tax=uncultured Sulfurovum sp. TaxID=269237 RepID=A0A6S6S776_9BACT|nr:MAG: NADH-ubiquinone oxidoreductase chain E (EC [uncultured Sulfurovum sp.]
MFEVASQIIICLILAALLGWIIGYLMGKATCKDKNTCAGEINNSHELHVDNKNTEKTATLMDNTDETLETVEVGTQPVLLTEAREGGKDNLQLIKGVGKVLEAVLNETGIYHFDQIAKLSNKEVEWLDNSMSFPGRIKRENWIEQAKELAEGKETEFSQRVERGEVTSSKKSD